MEVFISHTKRDKYSLKVAKELAIFLEKRSINVNFDEFKFKSGSSLIAQISSLISSSDKFIFICHPKALGSNWVTKELEIARNKAVENYPDNFMILFNIGGVKGYNLLPADLKGDLNIAANKVNYREKFYDLYLTLFNISFQKFVRSDHKALSEPLWAILERMDYITVTDELDGIFESRYTLRNYSTEKYSYTHKINYWATETDKLFIESFEAFDEKRNSLKVKPVEESFRGKLSQRFVISSDKLIKPNGNFTFSFKVKFKKAYESIKNEGDYDFHFEEKQYGRYKCSISLPRDFKRNKFQVFRDAGRGNGYIKFNKGRQIGHILFSIALNEPRIGHRYKIVFSPLEIEKKI